MKSTSLPDGFQIFINHINKNSIKPSMEIAKAEKPAEELQDDLVEDKEDEDLDDDEGFTDDEDEDDDLVDDNDEVWEGEWIPSEDWDPDDDYDPEDEIEQEDIRIFPFGREEEEEEEEEN